MIHVKAFCRAWKFWLGYCAFAYVMGSAVGLAEGWSWGDSVWYGFVTSTTTGYGDFAPETGLGRVLGVVTMVGGIFLLATVVANAVATNDRWSHDEQEQLFTELREIKSAVKH